MSTNMKKLLIQKIGKLERGYMKHTVAVTKNHSINKCLFM